MKKIKLLLPLLTAAATVFTATFGVACSDKHNKGNTADSLPETEQTVQDLTTANPSDESTTNGNAANDASRDEQQFDGLEVTWVGTSNTDEADTFELAYPVTSVEIDTSKIEVREVDEKGVAFGDPIAASDYTVKLYNGNTEVNLTDGKATVSDGGTYQVWVYKNSSRVENYTCKGFARVYVMNDLLSMQVKSSSVTTQVAGREDLITDTWSFTLTYNNWNKKELSASDVTITGFNPKKSGVGEATATYTEVNAKGEYVSISRSVSFEVTGQYTPNMLVLNPSVLEAGSYNSEITDKYVATNKDGNAVTDGSLGSITILADANGGDIEVKAQSATIEGNAVTNRLGLRGKGSMNARSIKLDIVGAAAITVYAASSASATRTLALSDADFDLLDESFNVNDYLASYTFDMKEGGTFYLSSVSGGINILYVLVEYED